LKVEYLKKKESSWRFKKWYA